MKDIKRHLGRFLTICTILVLAGSNVIAQGLTKVGTTAANFLQIEVGARALGMGGAYTGLAGDPSSLYWNTAGIGISKHGAAQYQYGKRYAGITQHFLGVTVPISSSDYLGLMIDYFDLGEMEVTTLEKPDGTGETFQASDFAIGLGYARQLTDKVYVGVLAKYIYESIWMEYAYGFAFDISTIYNLEEKGIRIGMNISNMGPDMGIMGGPHLSFYKEKPEDYPGSPQPESRLATKDFPLPLGFTIGVSTVLIGKQATWLDNPEHTVTLAASINDFYDSPLRTNWGVEYTWRDLLSLRAGLRVGYDTQKYSLGFGLDFESFTNTPVKLDYVWVDYGDLGSINVWSLEFEF